MEEKTLLSQPSFWLRLLEDPLPEAIKSLSPKKTFFVGIGTSYHAARMGEFLWREHLHPHAFAVESFDFCLSNISL